jgi:AraC family transcriptional activator of tynA and feaB
MSTASAKVAPDRAVPSPPPWQRILSANFAEAELYLRSNGPLPWDVFYNRDYTVCPKLMKRSTGEILFRRICCGPNRAYRGPLEKKRDEQAYFCLSYVTRGSEALDTGRSRFVINRGDIATRHSSQALSFESTEPLEKLSVYIPEDAMDRVLPHPLSYVGLTIGRNSAIGGLLAGYLSSLCRDAAPMDERTEAGIAEMTLGLVGAAIAAQGPAACTSPREALVQRILAFIDRNLDDPDLKPSQIAATAGISLRYLHLLFAAQRGHTVAGWIRARRLERCRADLIEPNRTVTEVAFRWGFSDAAQFSHVFSAKYGISPRAFRRANGGKLSPEMSEKGSGQA